MIIKCESSVVVLQKVVNEFTDQKGAKQKYYKLTVFSDPEAGSLKCNEEVFNNVKIGTLNKLLCEFNDDKSYFRAVQVLGK